MPRWLGSAPVLIALALGAAAAVGALLMLGPAGGESSRRARASAADAPLPVVAARAVEPVAGEAGVAGPLPGGSLGTDVPPAPGGVERAGAISPGAPSDSQIKRELEALQREQAKVERILLDASAPIRPGSGRFVWPVAGPVTSPFCERRAWEHCHPGIDIAAPTGTAIRAADSGQVVLAGMQGGYGNFSCIAHSRSLFTCYAHQSRILVEAGEVVSRGQVIGAVGCTGLCFGPHLHFEVRVQGRVADPLAYL